MPYPSVTLRAMLGSSEEFSELMNSSLLHLRPQVAFTWAAWRSKSGAGKADCHLLLVVFWCSHDPAEDPHLASQLPRHLVLPVVHVAVLVEDDLSLRAGRLLQVAVVVVPL